MTATARHEVAVNLLFCVPGVVGGSEDYAVRTLSAFADHGPDDIRLTLFVLRPFAQAHPDLVSRFPTVVLPASGRAKPLRVLAESTWLAWATRRPRFALAHHVGGRMPAVRRVPGILTVHDLQPLHHPERFHPVKRRFIAWSLPRSVRAAPAVITVSDSVGADVVARLHVPRQRVWTVSAGIEVPSTVPSPADAPAEVRARLDAGRRLLVYPAVTHPHKGHRTLLEAFVRLAERHPDLDLVLSGGRGAAEEEVEALAAPLGERVLRLGRTGREQLDATMAAAEAVVFPSEFEGFGLPVLEALALGVPVICSDIAPLREVAGDAAVKVRRGDAGAWVDAIEARLRGEPARAELAAAGRAQAARFTPERTAAQLEAVYRSVLEGARPEGGPRGAGPG